MLPTVLPMVPTTTDAAAATTAAATTTTTDAAATAAAAATVTATTDATATAITYCNCDHHPYYTYLSLDIGEIYLSQPFCLPWYMRYHLKEEQGSPFLKGAPPPPPPPGGCII